MTWSSIAGIRASSSRPSIRITPITGFFVAWTSAQGMLTAVQRPDASASARRRRQARTMSDERLTLEITGGVQARCQT